jgi:hypothetical protein
MNRKEILELLFDLLHNCYTEVEVGQNNQQIKSVVDYKDLLNNIRSAIKYECN